MSGEILFTTKEVAEFMKANDTSTDNLYYDTSSRSKDITQKFSPFTLWDEPMPVPGLPKYFSHSVEGIWQGLKIINQKTDYSEFENKRARKRKDPNYKETKFKYGDLEINLIEARKQIYVPAYKFMFENRIPKEIIESIYESYIKNKNIYLYDLDSNPDINNATKAYSHSSLLVNLLKNYFDNL